MGLQTACYTNTIPKEDETMRGYQIYVKTNKGWALYGKTPISAQANVVRYQLEQKGYEVKVKNLADVAEF